MEGGHLELVDMPVPSLHAVYARCGDDWVILVDRSLPPAERAAAIAHELVHHERGGGCDHPGMPPAWHAVVRREEERVDRIAARRLVPLDALAGAVDRRLMLDELVDTRELAEEFGVTVRVVERALAQLDATPRLTQ